MLRHHSLDGTPQAGYVGSGPADTALSILHALMPFQGLSTLDELYQSLGYPLDQDQLEAYLDALSDEEREREDERYDRAYRAFEAQKPVKLYDGTFVSKDVWRLHQRFVRAALLRLGEGRWQISVQEIENWIARGGQEEDILTWQAI